MAAKDSHDPGWNDPPTFTYDKASAIQAAAGTKKGISLNKRVAFPISGNLDDKKSPPTVNSPLSSPPPGPPLSGPPIKPPPVMQPSLPPPPPSVTSHVKSDVPQQQESEVKVLPEVKDRLHEVLQNLQVDANCDDEITKRIKIMEKMWTENKLNETIQLRIFELSEALSKDDAETADHIQKGLMVDHISQCSSWMSGIRHLINKKRQKSS